MAPMSEVQSTPQLATLGSDQPLDLDACARDLFSTSEPFMPDNLTSQASVPPLADLLLEPSDMQFPAELQRLPSASLSGFGAHLESPHVQPSQSLLYAPAATTQQPLLSPLTPPAPSLPGERQQQQQQQQQQAFLYFPAAPPLDFNVSAAMLHQGLIQRGSNGFAAGIDTSLRAHDREAVNCPFSGISFPDFAQAAPPAGPSSPEASKPDVAGSAHMQLAAIKHKNRAAQQRYRARQRQRQQESSCRIAELSQQIEELQLKQAQMAQKEAALGQFLSQSDPKPMYGGLRPGGMDLELMEQVGGAGGGPLWAQYANVWSSAAPGTSKSSFDNTMTFSAGADGPMRLTKDEVANLCPARFIGMWKDIINGVSVCLLRANGDLSSDAGKRMLELISEARNLKGIIQGVRPDTLAEVNAQTAQAHGPPSAALWRWVASRMTKLSPAQQQDCLQLRNAAFTSLGKVLRHRSELAHSLKSFAQIADAASEGYLSLMTVSAQLHSLLTQENCFNCQIMMALFGSILSPIQVAQCNVLSFPYQLDSLAFIEALASCTPGGVPPAVDLIERGAAAGQEPGPLPLMAAAVSPVVSVLCH